LAAPSKIRRAPGDRVKTDSRDALLLARLLRMDDLTAVTVPSIEQEAARDLVRAREDCRGDLMRVRHRLSKLLLRHGIVYYDGAAWTGRHDAWLRRQRFDADRNRRMIIVCYRLSSLGRSRVNRHSPDFRRSHGQDRPFGGFGQSQIVPEAGIEAARRSSMLLSR